MYTHIKTTHHNEDETDRMDRLFMFIGSVRQYITESDYQNIIELKDHKGTLIVTTKKQLTEEQKETFLNTWKGEPFHENNIEYKVEGE